MPPQSQVSAACQHAAKAEEANASYSTSPPPPPPPAKPACFIKVVKRPAGYQLSFTQLDGERGSLSSEDCPSTPMERQEDEEDEEGEEEKKE